MGRSGAAAALVEVRLRVLGRWRASQATCRTQNAGRKDAGRRTRVGAAAVGSGLLEWTGGL